MSALSKRFPRELKNNLGKYLGIFLLMAVAISLTAGFLVAASSIEKLQGEVRDTYNQEDGQFVANFQVSDKNLRAVEDLGVQVFPNFSRDVSLEYADEPEGAAHVMRVFADRTQVDLAAYYEGCAPQADDELAIDRVYAVHHGLGVGDSITVGGKSFRICGIVSLSDYQALFEKNSDFVFNAQSFCVGLVTQSAFDSFDQGKLRYVYSFTCDNRSLSDADRVDLEEDIADALSGASVAVSDFIDADANNGITYAADDVVGDQQMWRVLLWMIIAIMAFVFVILTGSTIEEESAVIGTLLASGYRKSELVRHYLAMPMIVGTAGALLGNVLGYTLFSEPMRNLYYNSYSLPPYEATFDPHVLVNTTVIPLVMLFVITLFGLLFKLRCTPLQFLRHETSRSSRRRGAMLPERLSFVSRFRLRVLLQNLPNFVTLFLGVVFSGLLMVFGLCMMPCVSSYADDLRSSLVCEHTYTLKAPLELEGSQADKDAYAAALKLFETVDMSAIDEDEIGDKFADIGAVDFTDIDPEDVGLGGVDLGGLSLQEFFSLVDLASNVSDDDDAHPINTLDNSEKAIAQAEKFSVASLDIQHKSGEGYESISVYGVQDNSSYWEDVDVSDNRVVIGNGLAEKYGIKAGDTFTVEDRYGGKSYEFCVDETYGSLGNMNVYLGIDAFNGKFDHPADYFNGYASDESLDIDSLYLVNDLTPSDMDKIVAQMEDSMGGMGNLLKTVAVLIALILMYLLTKTVIDHSARSISYMKVFGYRDDEINRLYIDSITATVIVSVIASIPLIIWVLSMVVKVAFAEYSGNFVIAIDPIYLAQYIGLSLVAYAVVAFLHVRRIKRVPLALALKVQE